MVLLVLVPQDLFDAIARGEYPEWALYIQTMDPAVRAGAWLAWEAAGLEREHPAC